MTSDRLSTFFRSFNEQNGFNDDGQRTKTSREQLKVEEDCLAEATTFLHARKDGEKVPRLERELHAQFLLGSLKSNGAAYAVFQQLTKMRASGKNKKSLDSSRPWLCYWAVHALNLIGEEIPAETKTDVVRFLKSCVHPDGGYGGGPGQIGHLATTYAAVLALASLGTEEALESIDRKSLYKFLRTRHQPSGAYTMHTGGEEDIRAPYLALSVASLLRILDDSLIDMSAEWVVSCQSYEGGFGGEPGAEAHGGYSFCAFACLCLLNRARLADIQALLKWLAKRQMQFEGGFQGRTGKHVDGCYSFWQAAIFRLIDTELVREAAVPLGAAFDARALQEYIHVCCQDPSGGLRDKPNVRRDTYHSCYVLSGLAVAQSFVEDKDLVLGGANSLVEEIHPIYNITLAAERFAKDYFTRQPEIEK